MRYLDLAEAFVIAEAVTGVDVHDLVHISRRDLLDSALHAPRVGFGDIDFFASLVGKAAVLCVRISKNHPLPDGNKRLAWMAMVVFLELSDATVVVDEDDAVDTMLRVAAGRTDEGPHRMVERAPQPRPRRRRAARAAALSRQVVPVDVLLHLVVRNDLRPPEGGRRCQPGREAVPSRVRSCGGHRPR